MNYSPDFVIQVNKVFHDVDKNAYESKHPEIFDEEIIRWQTIGEKFLKKRSLTLLDIGTGTGFVHLQIEKFLKKGDTIICSDISEEIMNVHKKRITNKAIPYEVLFLKLDGRRIPLDSSSLDVVTMNSVLHHIPNINQILREINRVLRLGGLLVIAHEPNKSYYGNKTLLAAYILSSFFFNPRQIAVELSMVMRIFEPVRQIVGRYDPEVHNYNSIVSEVNKRLLNDTIIEKPLTAAELTRIVDIHSPGAGGTYKNRGIDPQKVIRDNLSNYLVEHFETYGHLRLTSQKNSSTKKIDAMLKSKFPNDGSLFALVAKKISVEKNG